MKRGLALLLVVFLGTGCATGSGGVTVRGRQVTAVAAREAQKRPSPVEGELIATEPGRIWVLGKEQVFEVPLSSVEEVRVRRHDFGAPKAFLWSLIGAVLTGGALAAACGAGEGNENCGNVLAVVGGIWLATGGLAAASMRGSSTIQLPSPKAEDLSPYARFPQGIPEGLDPRSLRPSPSPSQ